MLRVQVEHAGQTEFGVGVQFLVQGKRCFDVLRATVRYGNFAKHGGVAVDLKGPSQLDFWDEVVTGKVRGESQGQGDVVTVLAMARKYQSRKFVGNFEKSETL